MAQLFISQERLDTWSAENRVRLDGDTMTLSEGRVFRLRPAVRFLRVAGEGRDANALVGKVVDEARLASLGADHYMSSVIIGDTAYDVQSGFLGAPLPRSAARGLDPGAVSPGDVSPGG